MRIDPKNFSLGWALGLVTVLATLAVGLTLGIELAVLTLAGGVLVMVIFVLWNSVLSLTGESPLTLEEAVSLAAPTAEEEQKRAVLRTLKDLEYERSVGKISEPDYLELSKAYRKQAKLLIRATDEGIASSRDRAEHLLEKRLRESSKATKAKKRAKTKEKPADDLDDSPSAKKGLIAPDVPESQEVERRPRRICPECETRNESDAKFCKKCGVELEVEA